MVHRFSNGPLRFREHLYWSLARILAGVEAGLRKAAAAAPEGIRSIAVDGWAVDYVRLGQDGQPDRPPFCYRDERTISAKAIADDAISPSEFFARTGAQPLRINTAYQLVADIQAGLDPRLPWLLLPEYVLHSLGGRRVAEYTNATHTGLVDLETGAWSRPIFERLGLEIEAAPTIVPPGTPLGKLSGDLTELAAFSDTELIAPACHDTASAISAIDADFERTAYIVSGTWSLVGTVVQRPINSPEAKDAGFTNQGAATGGYCFHSNVNGMWLLKQCIDEWVADGRKLDLPTLVAQAAEVDSIPGVIDVDAPPLLLAGNIPSRINHELQKCGISGIPDLAGNEPIFARVIFSSLALRYATVIRNLESLTGRRFERIAILGGGSRNAFLNRLTEEATGLRIFPGEPEGSTVGNFAIQLASGTVSEHREGFSFRNMVRAYGIALKAVL
jgi:rhamnulokinase